MKSPKQIRDKFEKDMLKNEQATLRRITTSARTAAKNVMNDLAERGPEHTGNFKNGWRAKIVGAEGGGATRSAKYPYSRLHVPKLKTTKEQGLDIVVRKKPVIRIFNDSKNSKGENYAVYACDLKRGKFFPQQDPPKGRVVKQGARGSAPTFRGEFVGPGNGKSTARANWFSNYTRGGAFRKAVKKGLDQNIGI
jgi:hypothetical protein